MGYWTSVIKSHSMFLNNKIVTIFPNLGLGGVQRKMVDIQNFVVTNKNNGNQSCDIIVREFGSFSFEDQVIQNERSSIFCPPQLTSIKKLHNLLFLFYVNFLLVFKLRPKHVLVFFHYSVPSILLYKLLFWNTQITISQDNILSLYNKKPHVQKRYPKWLIKLFYRISTQIIVQTHTAKRDLAENFEVQSSKIIVIPNWSRLLKKTNKSAIIPFQKRKYDLIFSGRFAEQKRVELIVEFVSQIKSVIKDFKVLFIGSGSEIDLIQRMIALEDLQKTIKIIPPKKNTIPFFANSKCIILTSEFEGHPMVLTEAMQVGTVPIVLEYPGSFEYLRKEYDSICEDSLKTLVQSAVKLYSSPEMASTMSKQATKTANTRFNYKKLLTETVRTITQ